MHSFKVWTENFFKVPLNPSTSSENLLESSSSSSKSERVGFGKEAKATFFLDRGAPTYTFNENQGNIICTSFSRLRRRASTVVTSLGSVAEGSSVESFLIVRLRLGVRGGSTSSIVWTLDEKQLSRRTDIACNFLLRVGST